MTATRHQGATMNIETATKNLAAMFATKYAEAIANGATEDQAINACRLLWIEAVSA